MWSLGSAILVGSKGNAECRGHSAKGKSPKACNAAYNAHLLTSAMSQFHIAMCSSSKVGGIGSHQPDVSPTFGSPSYLYGLT